MIEKLHRSSNLDTISTHDTDEYLAQLGSARTARGASEGYHNSPSPAEVAPAVRSIRNDIAPVFEGGVDETTAPLSLAAMKDAYWARASRVGTEHGARSGYDLEMYLRVGEERSYNDIKGRIEHEYSDDSIPRSVLDSIDAYHHELQINPAHAATITMELIGRHLSEIRQMADVLQEAEGLEKKDATSRAILQYITREVPQHIATIAEKNGQGDDAIRPVMNKASFYPPSEVEPGDLALTLSEDDAAGLIEVYDIQSRPYDDESLSMANEIARIPAMQMAMIRIQEKLIDVSKKYLGEHPERAMGNLENFSEIFVPEFTDGQMELLPNPKLLRAMVNNVLPGIAVNLIRTGKSLEDLSEEDIVEGVRIAAKEFKLFQSRIGQFDGYNHTDKTVQLESTFQVVCPANSLFPNYLTAHLAAYYEEEKSALLADSIT